MLRYFTNASSKWIKIGKMTILAKISRIVRYGSPTINFEKFSYGKNVTFRVVEHVKNIEKFIECFVFSQLPVQN